MAEHHRRRTVVVAITAIVVVAGGTTAWAMASGSGPSYRVARVAQGSVEQTLSATGTLSPVHLDSGAFQVSGTVRKVLVKEGQLVAAGQVLAVLDKSSLKQTLQQAKSTLASARTRLSDAESGQLDATNASLGSNPAFQSAKKTVVAPTSTPSPSQGGPTGKPTGTSSGSPSTGKIAADQAAIRRAQQAVDDALRLAQNALATEKSACASSTGSTSNPGSTATSSPTPSPTPTSSSGLTCSDAASALLADQTTVNQDETGLDQAELALTQDLQAAAKAASSSSAASKSSSTPSRGSTGSTGSTGSGSTVTAADLAGDQASIDQAEAQVATAQSDLAQATLRSAISGKVAAVTVSKGDSVNSGSTTPAVEVEGAGQDEVTIDLSASQIRHVKVGLPASVIPDGMSTPSTGKVVAIQSGGVESTTGSVSYPVTITVPQRAGLVNGAAAAVTIVVSQVDNVLTVPTSAVHRNGATTYVEILSGTKERRQTLKVGAVGSALTQVLSGLSAGQRVVLANLDASVPSSSSNLQLGGTGVRRFSFNGGSGGGTFPAGGPGGGTVTFSGPSGSGSFQIPSRG